MKNCAPAADVGGTYSSYAGGVNIAMDQWHWPHLAVSGSRDLTSHTGNECDQPPPSSKVLMIGGECRRKRIGKPGCEIRQWASESQNQTNLAIYVRFRGNEQLPPLVGSETPFLWDPTISDIEGTGDMFHRHPRSRSAPPPVIS